jgi:hypothetical protein
MPRKKFLYSVAFKLKNRSGFATQHIVADSPGHAATKILVSDKNIVKVIEVVKLKDL